MEVLSHMKTNRLLPYLVLFAALFLISSFLLPGIMAAPEDNIVNIGPPINTRADEFSPSITGDGKIMVFNSKRGGRYQDIYMSRLENDKWTEPVYMRELNSDYNDESPYITPDAAFIFFSSDRDGSFEMPADTSGKIKVSFDLYVSKNVDGQWETPIKVPGTVNSQHHERSPALSLDFNTLYYSSWPFGDVRQAKVMKADYVDGEFINPAVLPAPVNTGAQEAGFIPSLDGRGFYFSSMRGGGFGGWDLYYISYKDGKFGAASNLGPRINSEDNDIYLTLVGNTMFFCSNRQGGYGMYDIYTSKIPEPDAELKFIVKDKKTGKPMSVEMNLSTNALVEGNDTHFDYKKKTDKNGEAVITYKPQVKHLDVAINEEGYLPSYETIDIARTEGRPQLIELIPIEKESSFDIHSIHFDFESAKIKEESFKYLDALADYLKKHPTFKFEIIGHTDLHGTDSFNDKLSLDRARSVRDYLKNKGIDEKHFTIRGEGKKHPKNPKICPECDEENRRTEFKLLEK